MRSRTTGGRLTYSLGRVIRVKHACFPSASVYVLYMACVQLCDAGRTVNLAYIHTYILCTADGMASIRLASCRRARHVPLHCTVIDAGPAPPGHHVSGQVQPGGAEWGVYERHLWMGMYGLYG